MSMAFDKLKPRARPLALKTGVIGAIAMLGALVGGCTVGPRFEPPKPDTPPPSVWHLTPGDGTSDVTKGAIDETWWTRFQDPELDSLVQRLVKQNLDLASASERVIEAQAARRVTASAGMPSVGASVSQAHDRISSTGTSTLVTHPPGAPLEYDDWGAGLSASWELDLFGRVRRAVEAADAGTVAAEEARRGVALDALAELAADYMTLRGAQQREAIARRNLDSATHALELVENQYENGIGNTLDVARAKATRDAIAARVPDLQTTEQQSINAIGLLLAQPPRALQDELAPVAALPLLPPQVPAGLPSALLRRRPDIREAEARLHQATAETGVAVASFYPDVSLTGSVGTEGLQFGNLFSLASRAFSIGPSIDIPIFEGGRLRGTLKLRRAQQREAAIAYQKTVLQAWRDVDNAMTAYGNTQRRRSELAQAVDQERTALTAATQRYQQGSSSYLQVDTAQDALLGGEDTLAQADMALREQLVALYKALGGGWSAAG
ncbi:efflux transporter outer membrane subunit [Paraburkholderia sp. SIMBA_009]|uniref:NodT family efflux transporter outer membrane factor (OMF) lipoprotein n=1 Tax=Paraburkholderia tropica TaxID=92647 RepID=A0ABX5MS41_9BURK|nr:efflux transporter outer membrane subunit [Paraburkholderia tropica]MDE1140058.1 efflux transporter outer membrane subunit [Paraburkholderia tropica]PXX17993.1 NodT family efflux transporter outer membrane factor (OMF) lipoprotein [Paraburkholderia tropica]PZW85975.1 NodT family efflux transporter outer membrane factor (OMF) lipoprotein [Paraburkholderia tropica]